MANNDDWTEVPLESTAKAGTDDWTDVPIKNPAPKPEGIGGHADALLRGAAQGASGGFADELTALAGAAKDSVTSPVDFSTAYKAWKNVVRRADANAKAEHPYLYGGAQLAGGLATAAIPGVGAAANLGKGSLLGAAGVGAGFGALSGLGDSTADATTYEGAKQALGDTLHGAKVGALTGGAFYGGGKVLGAVADKLRPAKIGSVLLTTPEEAVKNYIAAGGADGVKGPELRDIAQRFPGTLDALKKQTIEGSQASRNILDQEGRTIKGSQIADILGGKAQEIKDRLAGINDDPEKSAAAGWLDNLSKEYAPKPGAPAQASSLLNASGQPFMTEAQPVIDRELPTNRIKDFLQSLDKQTQWETAPGQFTNVDNGTKQEIRGTVNNLLTSKSEAYADQMKKVAADAGLLNDVTHTTGNGSIQGFENVMKRVQKDRNFDAMKSIGELDQRMGTNYLGDLKNAEIRSAMNKSYTNGSRAVNLYSKAGESVAGAPGKFIGAVAGATVDKYGAPMARGLVDKTAQIQQMLNSSEGLQKLGSYANVLKNAAAKGNQSLAAAHFVLSQTHPEYNELMSQPNDQNGE